MELAGFHVTGAPSNVRFVRARVREACAGLGLAPGRLDALEAAVAEATTNAIEHGNAGDASRFVGIRVWATEETLVVRVTDEGRGGRPPVDPEPPDLDAKLRGEQSPRGWGLFLMRNLVDALHVSTRDQHNVVELVVQLQPRR
ncbi:MAG: ATP-binding protein [Actinobacteria bacterium]|nr:ATP-binding protein [Actinomycetota bacterium]